MVSSTRRLDRIMSSRRAPPGITQMPSLPFIYCIFNRERAASLPGWPQMPPVPEGREQGAWVGGLKAGGRHGSSLSQSPTTTSSSATSTRPGT